ncbi:epimerase [Amycolatopsis sp. NPDC048633]|uniref:epimerase n=1 Tax=Amycolatopsis sp. NPDC048633 TaxID=3157095 RepID=UPI0033DEA00C
MNVVLLGATGLVGHGVLHECLRDHAVKRVTAICRRPPEITHPKLEVVLHDDFADLEPATAHLDQVDACFFCVGVPSAGLGEAEYAAVTVGYAVAAADALLPLDNELTYVYVSGASASRDSRLMWARVKARAEDALLAYPFHTYVFRPGYIKPMYGARPRERAARMIHAATSWLYPLLKRVLPDRTTSTGAIGQAMLAVSRMDGTGPRTLTSGDINRLARK